MPRTELLDCVLVPIASKDDARTTARAVRPYVADADGHAVVVHVVEKAGGAPDKASVEQRVRRAEEMFAIVEAEFDDAAVGHECHVLYGTDVAERVLEAAGEFDADSIAFTPRGSSRWLRLVTGDVSHSLVTRTDRPVLVFPKEGDDG